MQGTRSSNLEHLRISLSSQPGCCTTLIQIFHCWCRSLYLDTSYHITCFYPKSNPVISSYFMPSIEIMAKKGPRELNQSFKAKLCTSFGMELLLLLFTCAEAGITGNASMIWAVLHQALYPYYTWHSFQMFQSNYNREHTRCVNRAHRWGQQKVTSISLIRESSVSKHANTTPNFILTKER